MMFKFNKNTQIRGELMRIFQIGFNYSQDGPGNRLVFHLQGCNMRCPWCSNPEGIPLNGSIMCADKNLIEESAQYNKKLDYKLLNQFNVEVVEMHPHKFVNSMRELSIDEVSKLIMSSKRLFFDNGGVTFTGGEVTLQFDEIKQLFKLLKQENISIAIETNATSPRLLELIEYVDYLIMDFKHYDSSKQRAVVGIGTETIKDNLYNLSKLKNKSILVRIPLINGFNVSKVDLYGFIDYFKTIDTTNIAIEFLKYHEYGKEKWHQCGLVYMMNDAHISDDIYNEFVNEFTKNGMNIIKT